MVLKIADECFADLNPPIQLKILDASPNPAATDNSPSTFLSPAEVGLQDAVKLSEIASDISFPGAGNTLKGFYSLDGRAHASPNLLRLRLIKNDKLIEVRPKGRDDLDILNIAPPLQPPQFQWIDQPVEIVLVSESDPLGPLLSAPQAATILTQSGVSFAQMPMNSPSLRKPISPGKVYLTITFRVNRAQSIRLRDYLLLDSAGNHYTPIGLLLGEPNARVFDGPDVLTDTIYLGLAPKFTIGFPKDRFLNKINGFNLTVPEIHLLYDVPQSSIPIEFRYATQAWRLQHNKDTSPALAIQSTAASDSVTASLPREVTPLERITTPVVVPPKQKTAQLPSALSRLAEIPEVHSELQLSEQQKEHLIRWSNQYGTNLSVLYVKMQLARLTKDEPMVAQFFKEASHFYPDAWTNICAILNPNQQIRLRQLEVQLAGPLSVTLDERLASDLNLTTEQRMRIDALDEEYRSMPRASRNAATLRESVLQLLTATQKDRWAEQCGTPFTFPESEANALNSAPGPVSGVKASSSSDVTQNTSSRSLATIVSDPALRDKRSPGAASGGGGIRRPYSLPTFTTQLQGTHIVRIRNPNSFSVDAGIRSGSNGVDVTVPPEGVSTTHVPNGSYQIFFVYSDQPTSLFQGDDFRISNNGIEIQIVKVVNGNYGIRRVK